MEGDGFRGAGGVYPPNIPVAIITRVTRESFYALPVADPASLDFAMVQPVYEPAPIVRKAVLDQYPQIADLLAPVFQKLTLETLQSLNAQIQINGEPAAGVAKRYLKSKGFVK
mgnify:CR=1 FL=1